MASIEGLKPFTEYQYSIILDGKEIKKDYFRLKTAPLAGQTAKWSITFGSGARYQPKYEGIWRTMAQHKPLAYLGLGDNLYIDAPKYQNVQRLHYYRRMLRQEYREMIASSAIYAIWDDHDMYDNDSEGGYGLHTTPYKMPNFRVFEQELEQSLQRSTAANARNLFQLPPGRCRSVYDRWTFLPLWP